jgi:hypothetical protein
MSRARSKVKKFTQVQDQTKAPSYQNFLQNMGKQQLTTRSPSRSDDLIWQTPSQIVELTDPFPEAPSARNLPSS